MSSRACFPAPRITRSGGRWWFVKALMRPGRCTRLPRGRGSTAGATGVSCLRSYRKQTLHFHSRLVTNKPCHLCRLYSQMPSSCSTTAPGALPRPARPGRLGCPRSAPARPPAFHCAAARCRRAHVLAQRSPSDPRDLTSRSGAPPATQLRTRYAPQTSAVPPTPRTSVPSCELVPLSLRRPCYSSWAVKSSLSASSRKPTLPPGSLP